MNELRTVVDTNVVVSALLLPNSVTRRAFDLAITRGTLLVSQAIIAELDQVLRRPKFDRYVRQVLRLEFLAAMVQQAELVHIQQVIVACRDPKDDKVLELAVNGRADQIVTGDRDLIALHPFRDVAIISPDEFVAKFASLG